MIYFEIQIKQEDGEFKAFSHPTYPDGEPWRASDYDEAFWMLEQLLFGEYGPVGQLKIVVANDTE